jgi:hypothetical protein
MNCPMCVDGVPGHGFVFEPPMEHFDRIFKHLATFPVKPTVALFGGEPLVRDDIADIVKLARSYDLATRVLTNGLRLADEDFCRRMVASRAHLLVSYDGSKSHCYRELRGSAKVLEMKLKAVENLNRLPRARVSYVTCLAWGLNHEDLPEIFAFCHRQHHILHGIYLMPLVQTWKEKEFQYLPDRMTTEDVEQLVAKCFPEHNVQFISLGLASHFRAIAKCFGETTLTYYGTHPNCESTYLLLSDGEKYIPIEHFLTTSLPEFAGAFLALERKLSAREKRWETSLFGRTLGALRLRNFTFRQLGKLQAAWVGLRHVRLRRVFKGRGLGKLYHALALPLGGLFGRKFRLTYKKHLAIQDELRIVVLPLEDDPILETERLERCPSVHVHLNPATGEFKYVPVCSWRLFSKQLLGEVAAYYTGQAPAAAASAPAPTPTPSA